MHVPLPLALTHLHVQALVQAHRPTPLPLEAVQGALGFDTLDQAREFVAEQGGVVVPAATKAAAVGGSSRQRMRHNQEGLWQLDTRASASLPAGPHMASGS
jgi:hypothetical protein